MALRQISAAHLAGALCAILPLILPASPQTAAAPLAAGRLLENIVTAADATQSYALYLPKAYTPARRWPIIYAFDPAGRGNRPVELYKDIAEKYGFILAGSNNSRNFSAGDNSKSLNAIWQDTHIRLALDERRTCTTGFSGGARVAGSMALSCVPCQIAGVMAHGAGYPNSNHPSAKDKDKSKTLYFLAVGDEDFNWPEVITVRREREEQALPYRVRAYPGLHQWAPPEVMEEAVEWMILKSMQAGNQAPDPAFVDQFFLRIKTEAGDADRRGDVIAQLNAYRALASDFSGLKDVAEYEAKLAALKKSPSLKSALRKEQDQILDQQSLQAEIEPKLRALEDGAAEDSVALRHEIEQSMSRLKDQGARSKDDTKRKIALRAFRGLWVEGIEAGQMEFQSRHFEKAEACFQLMTTLSDDPWPALLLAETRTAMGNKKQAIKDVREAIRRGLKNAEVLEQDSNLRDLQADPEFQKIVEGLKKN